MLNKVQLCSFQIHLCLIACLHNKYLWPWEVSQLNGRSDHSCCCKGVLRSSVKSIIKIRKKYGTMQKLPGLGQNECSDKKATHDAWLHYHQFSTDQNKATLEKIQVACSDFFWKTFCGLMRIRLSHLT